MGLGTCYIVNTRPLGVALKPNMGLANVLDSKYLGLMIDLT